MTWWPPRVEADFISGVAASGHGPPAVAVWAADAYNTRLFQGANSFV